MEIKILQVFYDKNGLPYKDKERTVHYPITSGTFLGASNTTQIRFYYDQLDELNESTFVAVSKLPNGKIGSEILENEYDSELQESYAVLNLSQFYTQYKGDVYISLQGYQGGVRVEQDENGIYSIIGTPTIQATGSIKLIVAYAPTFVGSGQTENITLQRVLAELSTKLGIRQETLHVEELPTVGNPNVWYVVNDDPNDTTKANIYIWNSTRQTYVWIGDNTLDLGEYYTKDQGEQFESDIDNRVASVENELSSVAQGSPKGTYATLADLQAAYPTGTEGIYVVQADGHWYYWNGSAWTDGGKYLATNNLIYGDRSFSNVNQLSSPYNDLNTLPLGSIVTYIVPVDNTNVANLPVANGIATNGTVMTFDYSNTEATGVQCQLFFENNGCVFYRNKYGASWKSWKELINRTDATTLINSLINTALSAYPSANTLKKALVGKSMWGSLQPAPYDDCDTFPANEIVSYAACANSLANKPSGIGSDCTVITLSYAQGQGGLMKTQLCIGNYKIFYRTFYETSWSDWGQIATEYSVSTAITNALNTALADYTPTSQTQLGLYGKNTIWATTQSAPYDDYNTFPANETICYAAGASSLAHRPNDNDNCICTTLSYGKGTPLMKYQICLTNRGSKVYFRGYYEADGWRDWQLVPSVDDVITALKQDDDLQELVANDLMEVEPYTMSMFEKIAVIGDSFASGLIVNPPSYSINVNKYNLSWIQIMARHFGITATNYSQNGWTIKDFLESTGTRGLAQLLQDTPKDLYYICMGINEDSSAAAVGTIADITNDYTQNPDTFYGNMARAIEQIQAHSPNGKIILCTTPSATDGAINLAIQEIATHYGIGYIHTYDDPYFASDYYNDFKTNHPTVVGYSGYAMAYARLTYQAIKNNVNYFLFFLGNN